jgi:hypothetical protein
LDGEDYLDHPSLIAMKHCPFCQKLFEPAWDVKFASSYNFYHSWCALSHFSTSIKCLFKRCGQKMHPDWWLLLGVKKPCVGEEAMLGNNWTTIASSLLQFDGEF